MLSASDRRVLADIEADLTRTDPALGRLFGVTARPPASRRERGRVWVLSVALVTLPLTAVLLPAAMIVGALVAVAVVADAWLRPDLHDTPRDPLTQRGGVPTVRPDSRMT